MEDYEQLKEELSEIADLLQNFDSDLQPAVFKLLITEFYDGDLPVQILSDKSLSAPTKSISRAREVDGSTSTRERETEQEDRTSDVFPFKEFVADKEHSSHQDKCLLAVYYTTEKLGEEEATKNDIQDRYTEARWRPPKDLAGVLSNTKNRKEWIDSVSKGWAPTYEGKNVVIHDLKEDES
jgi:hypothetical protein